MLPINLTRAFSSLLDTSAHWLWRLECETESSETTETESVILDHPCALSCQRSQSRCRQFGVHETLRDDIHVMLNILS